MEENQDELKKKMITTYNTIVEYNFKLFNICPPL